MAPATAMQLAQAYIQHRARALLESAIEVTSKYISPRRHKVASDGVLQAQSRPLINNDGYGWLSARFAKVGSAFYFIFGII
jgi:hypothetical protein